MDSTEARWVGQLLAQLELEALEEEWTTYRNPLTVWDAFIYARDHHNPIPEWVYEYLAECARGILDLSHRDRRPADSDVARAVQLGSRVGRDSSPFDQLRVRAGRAERAIQVHELIQRGISANQAILKVAVHQGLDESTVRRAVAAFEGDAMKTIEALLRSYRVRGTEPT